MTNDKETTEKLKSQEEEITFLQHEVKTIKKEMNKMFLQDIENHINGEYAHGASACLQALKDLYTAKNKG